MLKPKSKAKVPAPAPSPGPASPYLNAKREWDERYGDLLSARRNWQRLAAATAATAFFAVAGVIFLGAQSKVQPFVVAVDSLGTPIAVGRPTALPAGTEVDQRIVKATIAQAIVHSRSVVPDLETQQVYVDRAFATFSRDVAAKLTPFFRDDLMARQVAGGRTTVSIDSIIPSGKDTYHVDWTEQHFQPGSAMRVEKWRAIVGVKVGVEQKEFSNPDLFYWNPFGIVITSLSWQKVVN